MVLWKETSTDVRAAVDAWMEALIRAQFRVRADVACLLFWGEGIELTYLRSDIHDEMC